MNFVSNESGAVTVDWVVLTAALGGLALAVTVVISDGLQCSSDDVETTLRGTRIVTTFPSRSAEGPVSYSLGDWAGGQVRAIPGFGELLALSAAAPSATIALDPPGGHGYAVIEFDLVVGDSWDAGETGTISLGGAAALSVAHDWTDGTAPTITYGDAALDAAVTLTRVSADSGTWSGGANDDHTYRVRMVTANEGAPIALGAATSLDRGASDEFLGIANVTVAGADSP